MVGRADGVILTGGNFLSRSQSPRSRRRRRRRLSGSLRIVFESITLEKISLTAQSKRKICAEKLSSRISIQISTYTGHTLRGEILMLDYSFPLLPFLIARHQN